MRALLVTCGVSNFSHINRSANGAADAVAKNVTRSEGRSLSLGVGPPWLMDVINDDRPVTSSGRREQSGGSLNSAEASHAL